MPSITNVGGSLTSAVALTLIAWAVRFVRARNCRRQNEKDLHRQLGRYHATLTPAALQILVRQLCTKVTLLCAEAFWPEACVTPGSNRPHSTYGGGCA